MFEQKPIELAIAPMSEDMHQLIDHIKNCNLSGEEAGEMVEEAIKALLLAALEQLTLQHPTSSNGIK